MNKVYEKIPGLSYEKERKLLDKQFIMPAETYAAGRVHVSAVVFLFSSGGASPGIQRTKKASLPPVIECAIAALLRCPSD